MKKGVVKKYDPSKAFGFIIGEDKEDYFVHMSGLHEYFIGRGLRAGQKVSFDVDFGMRGDKAINVRLG